MHEASRVGLRRNALFRSARNLKIGQYGIFSLCEKWNNYRKAKGDVLYGTMENYNRSKEL